MPLVVLAVNWGGTGDIFQPKYLTGYLTRPMPRRVEPLLQCKLTAFEPRLDVSTNSRATSILETVSKKPEVPRNVWEEQHQVVKSWFGRY